MRRRVVRRLPAPEERRPLLNPGRRGLRFNVEVLRLRVVDDQVGSPTWARMLAEITSLLLAQNQGSLYDRLHEQCGIYHVAGSGYTSRYEWAKQILANDPSRSEQSVKFIEPGHSKDFPTPATRPLFSALDCPRFEKTFGLQLPPWSSTLKLAMTG